MHDNPIVYLVLLEPNYTVAQKSVPMFVAFHVIASLGVRVRESD